MALWIHNITPEGIPDNQPHTYAVKINQRTLVRFQHVRDAGAAECFRAAADALDRYGISIPHDIQAEEGKP